MKTYDLFGYLDNEVKLKYEVLNIDKSKLSEIWSEEFTKTQSKKDPTAKHYRWFGYYNGKKVVLTKNNERFFIKVNIFCKECGKIVEQNVSLCSCKIFNLKKSPILEVIKKRTFKCMHCSRSASTIESKEKREKTCLEKYGVKNVMQSQVFIDHVQECRKGHGKEIAAKARETYFKRTGFSHNMRNPEALKKMNDSWKKTVGAKTDEEMEQWQSNRMSSFISNQKFLKGKAYSKISVEFFDMLEKCSIFKIDREYLVGRYSIDGLIKDVCYIEFFGNFFHANPLIYEADDLICIKHQKNPKTAKDVWEKDKSRFDYILENSKIPILVIWEGTFRKDRNACILRTLETIKEVQDGQKTGVIVVD